jgi:hypothetical protein
MSPQALRETATHVVCGEVASIYRHVETKGHWQYTKYIAEIRVTAVEKGTAIKHGALVYARYWTRKWVGKPNFSSFSTSGHRGLPKQGDSIRVFLARYAYDGFTKGNMDGGFNVIGANGFEDLVNPAPPNPLGF